MKKMNLEIMLFEADLVVFLGITYNCCVVVFLIFVRLQIFLNGNEVFNEVSTDKLLTKRLR